MDLIAVDECFEIQYSVENEQYNNPVKFGTPGAACFDIQASVKEVLEPHEYKLIHTGLRIKIPPYYQIKINPRSGLALKHGITVLNAPGTIDNDYQGEIGIILINHSDTSFIINPGDRIAQGEFVEQYSQKNKTKFIKVDSINTEKTERGEGAYGSTGK